MTCAKVENRKSDAQQSVFFKKVRTPKYDAYKCGKKREVQKLKEAKNDVYE